MTRKVSKKSLTLYLIVAVILIVSGIKFFIDSSRGDLKKGAMTRFKGNPSAPLHIVEFIDFQCPACAYGVKYLKQVMGDHPDLIYLQMKYFPLTMHKHSMLSARYAQCAASQGAFWPFEDLMIERQGQWQGLVDA